MFTSPSLPYDASSWLDALRVRTEGCHDEAQPDEATIYTVPRLPSPPSQQALASETASTRANSTDVARDRRSILVGFTLAAVGGASGSDSAGAAENCPLVDSPSGLQFCDVQEGTGAAAVAGSLIKAHYTGRLASNSEVFDSSYPRGSPLLFKVGAGEVIKGWDLGIVGTDGIPPMKIGGKRRLVIPPELAYGSRGAGRGLIPPNSTLIFDVEFVSAPKTSS